MIRTENIAQEFLSHLKNRNLQSLVSLFHQEVLWEIPGDIHLIKWLGKRKNRNEVEEFYKLLWDSTNAISAAITCIIGQGKDIIIKGSFTSEMCATKKRVTSLFFIHMVVIDGLIAEYTLLEDSFAVSEAMKN